MAQGCDAAPSCQIMEITKKRRLSDIVLGLFLLSHPGPVLLHIIAVTLFALLAAWPRLAWGIIALVVAAHAAMQLSIAMVNDYSDRQLDAESKPGKPIPRGLVRPVEALFCGLLLIVVIVLLLLPLHRLALLISLCYLALGQGYNLGLKRTPLSGIVFALAMPLIPLYAFVGMGRMLPGLFWLVPVGVLLGVALNLANALPDIEEDAAGDARTLAVVLGAKRSLLLCRLLIMAGGVLIGILAVSRVVPVRGWVLIPTLLVTALAVATLFLVLRDERAMRGRKLHFYISALTCIVLAAGWLIGVIV